MPTFVLLATALAAFAEPRSRLESDGSPDGHVAWSRGPRAPARKEVALTFLLKQQNVELLKSELEAVSDPASARYGQHLSNAQVHELVAPTPAAIDAVTSFIRSAAGAEPKSATPNGDMLTVTVPVSVAESMLNCEYHVYEHASQPAAIRTPEYSLPASIRAHVAAVSPTVQLPLTPPEPSRASTASTPNPIVNDPTILRKLYGVDDVQGKANTKQAVTAFLGQRFSPGDLSEFYSLFLNSSAFHDATNRTIACKGDDGGKFSPGALLRSLLVPALRTRRVELETYSSVTSMPHSAAGHWHTDTQGPPRPDGAAATATAHCITVFVPLLNMSEPTGPPQFLPGSHLSGADCGDEAVSSRRRWSRGEAATADKLSQQLHGEALASAAAEQGAASAECPEARAEGDAPPTTTTMTTVESAPATRPCSHILPPWSGVAEEGSAILFDSRVRHRGGRNRSERRRPILYMGFMAEWFVDRLNFNERQTRSFDAWPTPEMRKLAARVDARAYVAALEAELGARGVDVEAMRSARRYKTETYELSGDM